jgi:proteasome activator-like protein
MTSPADGQEQQQQSATPLVIGPDGRPVETDGSELDEGTALSELVPRPDKVMRVGSMIKQLLDEVRAAPLDEASRVRMREIHRRSIEELEDGLAPELRDELDRLSLPFSEGATPSDSELRIAQAQLVGWLEGLFHGIQTALFAQQMAARAQLDEMRRRALPGPNPGEQRPSGPYL